MTVAVPPSAKNFGDLETSIHFGLSALSGKAEPISKYVSKTLNILETSLEIGRKLGCVRFLATRAGRFWDVARKEAPRAAAASARRGQQHNGWLGTTRQRPWLQFTIVWGGRQLNVSTLITDKSKSAVWQAIGTLAFVWWNTSLSPPVARRKAGRAELDFVVSQIRAIRRQTDFAVMGLGEVCTDDLNAIVQGLDDPQIAIHDATSRNGRLKFDTAVIYDRGKVALEKHRSVVDRRGRQSLKTGEVVEFSAAATGDTFHLVVSHWPSRLSVAQSAPERAELGIALRWTVDNIRTDASPYVVLMGDYNDDPFSPSLSEHLLATRDRYLVRTHRDLLYNPFWKRLGESHDHSDDEPPDGVCGTYFYHKGRVSRWFTFDQMIFSSGFLQGQALALDETNSGILVPLDLRAKLLNPKEIFDHLPVLGLVELRSNT